jgi:hypothetical protein
VSSETLLRFFVFGGAGSVRFQLVKPPQLLNIPHLPAEVRGLPLELCFGGLRGRLDFLARHILRQLGEELCDASELVQLVVELRRQCAKCVEGVPVALRFFVI